MHITQLAQLNPSTPTAGDRRFYERQPSQDSPIQEDTGQPYFPEGGVAAPPFMIVNPISHGTGNGNPVGPGGYPSSGTYNELVGQVAAEWIEIRDSKEQGVGVPWFKRWPRQFHSETYNFDSLAIMPFPDQLGPPPIPTQRPMRIGWSTPKYAEQYESSAAEHSIADLMQTSDPASLAFAIGWGYVG